VISERRRLRADNDFSHHPGRRERHPVRRLPVRACSWRAWRCSGSLLAGAGGRPAALGPETESRPAGLPARTPGS